jgi:hypothetical protein
LAACGQGPGKDEVLLQTQQTQAQTEQTLPPQTDPVETLPPQTDPPPTLPLPVQTEPAPTLPLPPQTEPPVTEPPATETQPIPTQPIPTEPIPTETVPTEPIQTEPVQTEPVITEPTQPQEQYPDPNGSYTSRDDVALYIHVYGCLPSNFITKAQARKLGWKSGALERYAPGKCIGGDVFKNREGILPGGHTYYECDIDTLGSYSGRGAKRIVFSTDGLIYYTDDHYESFTLLYGQE